MKKIGKILVAVDFSAGSEPAFDDAAALAGQLKAALLLTHVVTPLGYPIDFALVLPAAWRDVKRTLGEALEKLADRGRRKGIPVETRLLKGDPADEIIRAAETFKCDLIAIGTHGRKGVSHFMNGSIAEKVIRTASVPVVTVRMKTPAAAARRRQRVSAGEAVRRLRPNRASDDKQERNHLSFSSQREEPRR